MKKYLWRKSLSVFYSKHAINVKGKLAFKTQSKDWLNTNRPVIALVSIHSNFHKGVWGDLKMNAFITTIKETIRGEVTVLLADQAHVHVLGMHHLNPLEVCIRSAQEIVQRFEHYFEGCKIAYWHDYICNDPVYDCASQTILDLFRNDCVFRKHLMMDAEKTFTEERSRGVLDRSLYLQKTIQDLLEQCIGHLVLAAKGYRFQLYPGNPFASTEYIDKTFLKEIHEIEFIPVFLTIEKKVILSGPQQELATHSHPSKCGSSQV